MALTVTNTPSTSMSTTGAACEMSNFFTSMYGDTAWDSIVVRCADKYNLPQILNYIGEGTVNSTVFNWAEEGALIKLYTIASTTGAPGTEVEITLTETDPYFAKGDVILLPSTSGDKQKLVQVKEVALSPAHVLTVEPLDGANILASNVTNGGQIMWVANLGAPCGELNDGRIYSPTKRSATAQIIQSNRDFCYDNESQLIKIKDKYVYSINEKTQVKEFNLAVSNYIIFGEATDSPTTLTSGSISGDGVIATIMTGGTVGTWAGDISEDDLQDICTELVLNSPYASGEWLVLGGSTAIAKAKKALKDYFVTGGAGSFTADRQKGKAGFDVSSYTFNGATLQLHNLHIFDQTPAPIGSGGVNYQNALLFLNITKTNDGSATQVKYVKGFDGEVEKMIMTESFGHSPATKGGVRSMKTRCFERGYSSNLMLVIKCVNSHGFFYGV